MIVLLGPQRFRPTLAGAMRSRGVRGPVAMVTAGWQEREGEDEELRAHVGYDVVNLLLYQRCESIFEQDPELFRAVRRRQDRLRDLQEVYRTRLDRYLEAVRELMGRRGDAALLEPEIADALHTVRELDAHHGERIRAIHEEFEEQWQPAGREAVARQRNEIAESLASVAALTIAGGHVAVLLNRMRLLDIAGLAEGRHLIAWSAGAMVLADRVVVFHDRPPQGPGNAEVLDIGLGRCTGVVPLPHARRRLRLDDRVRVALFSRRFAPALCATLDAGSRLDWGTDEPLLARHVFWLAPDGAVPEVGA